MKLNVDVKIKNNNLIDVKRFTTDMTKKTSGIINELLFKAKKRFNDMVIEELEFYPWRGTTSQGTYGYSTSRISESQQSGYLSIGKIKPASIQGKTISGGFGSMNRARGLKTRDGYNLTELLEQGASPHMINGKQHPGFEGYHFLRRIAEYINLLDRKYKVPRMIKFNNKLLNKHRKNNSV